MKRTIAILLALLMALSLSACGGSNSETSTESPKTQQSTTTPIPTESQDSTNEEERKTLDEYKKLNKLPTVTTVIKDSTYLGESDDSYIFGLYSATEAKTNFDKYVSAIEKAGYTCQLDDRDDVDYGYWIVKDKKALGAAVLSYYDYKGTGIVLPIITVILF